MTNGKRAREEWKKNKKKWARALPERRLDERRLCGFARPRREAVRIEAESALAKLEAHARPRAIKERGGYKATQLARARRCAARRRAARRWRPLGRSAPRSAGRSVPISLLVIPIRAWMIAGSESSARDVVDELLVLRVEIETALLVHILERALVIGIGAWSIVINRTIMGCGHMGKMRVRASCLSEETSGGNRSSDVLKK